MKKEWINRKENPACILFFNGWGMDHKVLNGMDHGTFDVCMFHDYEQIEPLQPEDFQYEKIHVVAWSLGVCAANAILKKSDVKITSSLAINGTPFPWHDEWAIPQTSFQRTLSGWDDRNRFKFNLRMFGGKANLEKAAGRLSYRTVESQKRELHFFYDLGRNFSPACHLWDLALVGTFDLIVPSESQLHYWNEKVKVVQKDWPHFPFLDVLKWEEIIKLKNDH